MSNKGRVIVMALALLTLTVITKTANAGNWSIHCVNNSCEASQGRIKVFWSSNSYNNTYSGTVSGVEGLPISLEDFESAEKKVDQQIEKSVTSKNSAGTDKKISSGDRDSKEGPASKMTGSQEKAFSRRNSMSQSKTKGKKISIDYTLAFVKWVGDTKMSWEPLEVKRCWGATELIMSKYGDGTIQQLMESFFFAKNADKIDEVQVDAKLNDDNRDLVMTKFIGLTQFPGLKDLQKRYSLANDRMMTLVYGKDTASLSELNKLSDRYATVVKELKLLVKPGQTALKLYEKNKELAFAKWIGDNKVVEHITDPTDRYVIALDVVKEKGFDTEKNYQSEFEGAITSKDQSVQVVTFKSNFFATLLTVIPVVFGGGIIVGGAFWWRRRKSNRDANVNIKSINEEEKI